MTEAAAPEEETVEAGVESDGGFLEQVEAAVNPKSDAARQALKEGLEELLSSAAKKANIVSADAVSTLEDMIADIDQILTNQINDILHHEEYQKVEGAWRGLSHLVNNTQTNEKLKINFLNISKQELSDTLLKFKGAKWEQGPIFKAIYQSEFNQFGGNPYGCIIGDYQFDASAPDVATLGEISQIAAVAHAPFIAAAAPSILEMDSWLELGNPAQIAPIFDAARYAPWRSFRDSEDARYVGLTLPRVLARLPYGSDNPVKEFAFVEDTGAADHGHFCWMNSAYAMAVNINQSFTDWGWASQIVGPNAGGRVADLPIHTFPTDDDGEAMKCPTEIAIVDDREKALSECGFMPLSHKKNEAQAVFFGANSAQKPTKYIDEAATANAHLATRLPYIFAVSRFAHYLKVMGRELIGQMKEAPQIEKELNIWINQYVEPNPVTASEAAKARRPLAGATIKVVPNPEKPGAYETEILIRPHFKLEELKVAISLVSSLD